MTSNADKPGDGRLVADTYRSLATEQTPEHLDQRVLGMATRARRTRYSRTRAWVRPLAWAATIGLSIAVVLEITRVPLTEPETIGITTSSKSPATPGEAPHAGMGESQPLRPAALETGGANGDDARTSAAEVPAAPQKDDVVVKKMGIRRKIDGVAKIQAGPAQPTTETRADSVTGPENGTLPGAEPGVTGTPAEARAAAKDDSSTAEAARTLPIKQAPATAQRKTGTSETAAAGTAPVARSSFSAVSATDAMSIAAACPDTVREDPESWLDCIGELREQGLDDLAQAELDEFRRIYPDRAENALDK